MDKDKLKNVMKSLGVDILTINNLIKQLDELENLKQKESQLRKERNEKEKSIQEIFHKLEYENHILSQRDSEYVKELANFF